MAGAGSPGGGPRTATMFACVTTLSNTLLGVSVVGVAGGFARAGCAVGTFYLILFACLAGSGLHLLARSSMTVSAATKRIEDAKAAEEEGGGGGGGGGAGGKGGTCFTPSSFRAVALVGAPRWAFLIDVSVALKCFGVATSYLVVIGDLMPTAMADILGEAHADSFLLDRRLWVTAGFLLAAPLAFSRTLGALKYTATLAISLVVFLAGMVMSFWIFPGLDACPGGGDSSPEILLEGAASDGTAEEAAAAEAGATEEGVEFSARGLLSSAAALAGMATPSPQVVGMSAGAGGDEFEAEGDGDSCFEGANAVGSVRTILQTLPIFVFCFTCHQNIFTICNEIVRPTPARVDAVIVCAMLVATTTYLSLSWGAYATFGVGVEGDLLETYPRTGLLTAARISVSILVMSCYPLQAHPSRLCILSTWKAFSADMQEAYAGLLAADEEGGNGHGSGVASSAPDAPVASIAHSGSGSDSSSSGRGGRGSGAGAPPSGEGERGRRRIAGGARREAGAKQSAGLSPEGGVGAEAEAQREAELEALLSDATQPLSDQQQGAGGTTGASGVGEDGDGGSDAESRGGLGGGAAPRGALSSRGRGNGDAESADAAQPGTVRGEVEEPEVEAFWTSVEGFRHILVTGAFLGLSYAIAMAVDDLGVLLEVVGATGSTTIAFILPGLLYLKVHPEPHPKRSLATLQLAVGLLIIPVALTVIALGESAEGRR